MSEQDKVADEEMKVIIVFQGTDCVSSQSPLVLEKLMEGITEQGLSRGVQAKFSGCHGCCEHGPIVIVEP